MTKRKIPKVMFLCTANSCRSQMAEGIARYLGKGIIEPYSAGLFSFHVHSRAIEVMKELGIDISQQKSKDINKRLLNMMDIIITLCGHAEESCPTTPPEIKRIHWPIKDPVGTAGTEKEIMDAFRKTRDEIKAKIERFVYEINVKSEIT
ncbi:MAG: arsenate reductase ArsC [Thermodesulfovibrionia bacterium]|jgi:arsenate reductase|nr:arsenate reductase ArsC [Thermodesulfovibrionia bacterium]